MIVGEREKGEGDAKMTQCVRTVRARVGEMGGGGGGRERGGKGPRRRNDNPVCEANGSSWRENGVGLKGVGVKEEVRRRRNNTPVRRGQ